MKLRLLVGLVVGSVVGWGQANNVPKQITLGVDGPQGQTSVSLRVVGNSGLVTYYYWVVPVFTIGMGQASRGLVVNAPNTLSAGNYVQVNWSPVSGVIGYHLLRTNTSSLPASCNCLLSTTVAVAYSDQGAVPVAFAYTPVGSATAHITIDNQNYSIPRLLIDTPINPTLFASLPSADSSNGLIYLVKDSTSTGVCNAGGGVNTPSLCWSNGTIWIAIGGGSPPGGSSGQIQVNSSGAFAGQSSIFDAGSKKQSGVECTTGTVGFASLTTVGASQEITILGGITPLSGNIRWDSLLLSETTQFAGSGAFAGLTVSVGRPGVSTHAEMTNGANFPLMVSSGDVNYTSTRPAPPIISTTYSVVLNFAVTGGTISLATSGSLTWELCGYAAR